MIVAARCFALLAVVVVLQTELFAELRVFGVMPELLLGLTIAAGWAAGADRGAVVGFVSGIVYDVFLSTPFALNALTYTLVGYGVGAVAGTTAVASERGLRRVVSFVGVGIGVVTYALAGQLLADRDLVDRHMVTVALLAPLLTAPFMPLLHRAASWALAGDPAGATPRRLSGVLK